MCLPVFTGQNYFFISVTIKWNNRVYNLSQAEQKKQAFASVKQWKNNSYSSTDSTTGVMARYVNDEFKLADFNRPWGPFFSTTSKSSRFFLSKNFSSLIDSFELCGLKDKYVNFLLHFNFYQRSQMDAKNWHKATHLYGWILGLV